MRPFFLIHTLLLGGTLLVVLSCQKDDDKIDVDEEPKTGTFTDLRDGTVYKTVTIGEQIWMAENLSYLPGVVGPGTGSSSTPYYYVYGYSGTSVDDAKATDNYAMYGVLYNWPAAMANYASSLTNPSEVPGICPAGWHLPSDAEWTELTDHLGGVGTAGGKLKDMDTSLWSTPNEGATNKSGFTALPGGGRSSNGAFGLIGYNGYWWSAYGTHYAWYRALTFNANNVISLGDTKDLGFSVRCVRD